MLDLDITQDGRALAAAARYLLPPCSLVRNLGKAAAAAAAAATTSA